MSYLTLPGKSILPVCDTLARFRPASHPKATYADDYAALSGLQKFATEHDVGVVLVHHDRKSGADGVFDTVAGTLGLTVAVDTILMLKRRGGRLDETAVCGGHWHEAAECNDLRIWSQTGNSGPYCGLCRRRRTN
jgi:hypothetical protein